jgi:hypothetical protein
VPDFASAVDILLEDATITPTLDSTVLAQDFLGARLRVKVPAP